ncbi:hypothetical protein I552_8291 [Mycobacterium xenopi 3993]|nr:hypothetical protein I552_8291 [Mycobacterium xenopi 3993]
MTFWAIGGGAGLAAAEAQAPPMRWRWQSPQQRRSRRLHRLPLPASCERSASSGSILSNARANSGR